MLNCPKCKSQLARAQNSFGNFWHCKACDGSVVTMSLLRKFVPRETLNALWQTARRGNVPQRCSCPGCENMMQAVRVQVEGGSQRELDVCTHCQSVWLDAGEWHHLSNLKVVKRAAPRRKIQAGVRERIAQRPQLRPVKERRYPPKLPKAAAGVSPRRARPHQPRVHTGFKQRRSWGEGPVEFWHWIPALFGMPVEDAQPAGHRNYGERPWMTWILAGGIFVVSALAMFDLQPLIGTYGLIPSEFDRLGGLTWLTSFFLHAGPIHLLGNLYFLVVFGDNVEQCFGALELLFLIVVATFFGDFVHILLDPDSTIPCVGASGGISGVIAFYALRFPKTKLSMLFWFIKPFWFRMSAIWLFCFWVVLQVFISGQQMAGLSNISGGAHLGGAFVGWVAWLLWRLGGGERDCRPALKGIG